MTTTSPSANLPAASAEALGSRVAVVHGQLLRSIRQGDFSPGEKLPTLDEMSAHFEVSINTVRKAIAVLVKDGCLTARQGAGIFIPETEGSSDVARVVSVMQHFSCEDLGELQTHALKREVILCTIPHGLTQYEPAIERQLLQQVLTTRQRGLLANCTPIQPQNLDLIDSIQEAGIRVIHINHYDASLPRQCYLLPDYHKAGYMAAVHLLIHGYNRLVYSTHERPWPAAQVVFAGFRDALKDYGVGFDKTNNVHRIKTGEPADLASFRRLVESTEGRLGILALNEADGDGLRREATECGYDVPGQIGIVAPTYPENAHRTGLDRVAFDHLRIICEAVDFVTAENWTAPRELRPPTLERHGTVAKP